MVSDARKRANEKWNDKNKIRKNYLSHRSRAMSFIKHHATLEDVEKIRVLLDEREEELKNKPINKEIKVVEQVNYIKIPIITIDIDKD